MSLSSDLGERKEVELTQGTIRYRECGTGEPIVPIPLAMPMMNTFLGIVWGIKDVPHSLLTGIKSVVSPNSCSILNS